MPLKIRSNDEDANGAMSLSCQLFGYRVYELIRVGRVDREMSSLKYDMEMVCHMRIIFNLGLDRISIQATYDEGGLAMALSSFQSSKTVGHQQ